MRAAPSLPCFMAARRGGRMPLTSSSCGTLTAQWFAGFVASTRMMRSPPINYPSNSASMMWHPSSVAIDFIGLANAVHHELHQANHWLHSPWLQRPWQPRKTWAECICYDVDDLHLSAVDLQDRFAWRSVVRCSLLCNDGIWRNLLDCKLIKIWIWWWWWWWWWWYKPLILDETSKLCLVLYILVKTHL